MLLATLLNLCHYNGYSTLSYRHQRRSFKFRLFCPFIHSFHQSKKYTPTQWRVSRQGPKLIPTFVDCAVASHCRYEKRNGRSAGRVCVSNKTKDVSVNFITNRQNPRWIPGLWRFNSILPGSKSLRDTPLNYHSVMSLWIKVHLKLCLKLVHKYIRV